LYFTVTSGGHTLATRRSRTKKEKERKKKKIAIFFLVIFCQVCLVKKKFWAKYTNQGGQVVTLKPRGARERKKERKKNKIAIFFLVIFCQVCLLKNISRQNTRIKAAGQIFN